MSSAELQTIQFPWAAPEGFRILPPANNNAGHTVDIELLNGERLQGELIALDTIHASLWLCFETRAIRSLSLKAIRAIKSSTGFLASTSALDTSASAGTLNTVELVFKDQRELKMSSLGFKRADHGLFIFPLSSEGKPASWFFPYQNVFAVSVDGKSLPLPAVTDTASTPTHPESKDKASTPAKTPVSAAAQTAPASCAEELVCALHDGRSRPQQKLGELLLDRAAINREQLEEALSAQENGNKQRLGELLVASGAISEITLLHALADKLGIPFVDVRQFDIESDTLELIPAHIAKRQQVLPLVSSGGELIVAVPNPLDFVFEQELQFILNAPLVAVFANPQDLAERIALEYEADRAPTLLSPGHEHSLSELKLEDITQRLAREAQHSSLTTAREEPGLSVSDNALVRFVNKIILDAYEKRASDIHIESSKGSGSKIRMRVDGVLHDYLELQPIYRKALVSRIKVMSNLDISEHRHAQDGKINFSRYAPIPLQLRVAILPTTDDEEDVVLRLLGASEPIPLEKLQLGQEYLTQLQRMIRRSHGLILVCGPTGSGKTTTLHSILREINSPERKIWTAEDPIEISQPGLRQVQINARIGWTFAMAMRAFLRADPDVIMVGEMRDAETTNIGIEASLTGHLVFSTLHTNSAAESVVRLLEMGMDPFNFADALIGILSQRLARRLCSHCKREHALSDTEMKELAQEYCTGTTLKADEVLQQWHAGIWQSQTPRVFAAVGCAECHEGYKGRIGIYELLSAPEEVKSLIRTQGSVPDIQKAAMAAGMKLLHQDALSKVLQGDIDLPSARAISS